MASEVRKISYLFIFFEKLGKKDVNAQKNIRKRNSLKGLLGSTYNLAGHYQKPKSAVSLFNCIDWKETNISWAWSKKYILLVLFSDDASSSHIEILRFDPLL